MKTKAPFFLIVFFITTISFAQQSKLPLTNCKVEWQLIGNNLDAKGRALAKFIFINKGDAVIPKSGWTLFFNSSQPIEEAKISTLATISHVNGDIFKLIPGPSFKNITPNDSLVVEYYTDGTIINYTASPSGLYFTSTFPNEKVISVSSYKQRKLSNTVPNLTDAARVYELNSSIKDIPYKDLPKVIPTPVEYKENEGVFYINGNTSINTDKMFANEADYLIFTIKQKLAIIDEPTKEAEKKNSIYLKRDNSVKEGYKLTIDANGIVISASSSAGIFYGIQSLLQLCPPSLWKGNQSSLPVPFVFIKDAPRFPLRSLLIDVARNFKPKEEIFKIIDLMALYKMNNLHFHFCDDEAWRIEMPSLPELTSLGSKRGNDFTGTTSLPPSYAAGPFVGKSLATGYYTRDEFIQILQYANARHVQVVPEIESPGHARAAIKAMDLRYRTLLKKGLRAEANKYLLRDLNDSSKYSSAQQWTDNVICVAMPSVYNFVETVVTDLISMYREANASLTTIHLGGDEVPAGVWEKSPLCLQLIKKDSAVKNIAGLWDYYYNNVYSILQKHNLFLSGWEEVGMHKLQDGKSPMVINANTSGKKIQLNVWNNAPGWGQEDLPYKLANAGYKVVLSPVSNNYLDLAYSKHPDELGYYWGGFQDLDKPFYFIPFNYYKNIKEGPDGNSVSASLFTNKEKLTDEGRANIVGVQGLLWAENLRTIDAMEYLLLPKMLGVAERAWAADPAWAQEEDSVLFNNKYEAAWSVFVNQVGKIELPLLDNFAGGFAYRIPPPGVIVKNGEVLTNTQLPGLVIKYTSDGSAPTMQSKNAEGPIKEKGRILIASFDTRGRSSRVMEIKNQ